MQPKLALFAAVFMVALLIAPATWAQTDAEKFGSVAAPTDSVRFASFNISFNRKTEGQLASELESGNSEQAMQIAEIIQQVRPDVILLNEFDYDEEGKGVAAFRKLYLGKMQNGQQPIEYEHVYFASVNTGVDSGVDMDNNDKKGEPTDGFGFGNFPGQYGMVVLSKYEIDAANVRTFQKFLWKDMPNNNWPIVPDSGKPFWGDDVKKVFRLSSKSHWDVPVKIGDQTVHFLTCHPTPPVFDKEEDRNGCRNHDEIRMFADYVSGKGDYLYDDNGKKGGLEEGSHFIVAGDLNSDPSDGDSKENAVGQLLKLEQVNNSFAPTSTGAAYYSEKNGGNNKNHKGDPNCDTGAFSRGKNNLRIDYCLPSTTLTIKNAGVYWPKPDEAGGDLVGASDHRLVWIDIAK